MNSMELKNVTKRYKEFALDNVSLTLPGGSIMGFIGENGAGKSTTIKLILDLIQRDSGEILVFGKSNLEGPKAWREDVGVVLDESSFPEMLHLTEVNHIMALAYKNWDSACFFRYAERFDLRPKQKLKEYSKGMKMKLSIAVALSHKAKLLILDEATGGLDPLVRDEILDVFLEFVEDEEHAIFMSSHITSDLEKICDYITFIYQGKIVLSEAKDELLEAHGILKCSQTELADFDPALIKGVRKNSFGVEALVLRKGISGKHVVDHATLEDIMLYYAKEGTR